MARNFEEAHQAAKKRKVEERSKRRATRHCKTSATGHSIGSVSGHSASGQEQASVAKVADVGGSNHSDADHCEPLTLEEQSKTLLSIAGYHVV